MWNKIKFFLGFKVVIPCVKGYVVTRKSLFIFRECLDKDGGYWWKSEMNWASQCVFKTKEEADHALKCFI